MVHFCVFGSYEGPLASERRLHVTLFASCDLHRLPLAHTIAAWRHGGQNFAGGHFFLTVFGSTTLASPPLAEECLALLDAVRSGTFSLNDWDAAVVRPDLRHVTTLTLFGSLMQNVVPGEEKELEALALPRQLGRISAAACDVLVLAIGQKGATRLDAVRQAAAMSLAPAA
jgi:hypothetical protein